jgi:APA family basic amino acid/polyamine antiporter
VCIHALTDRQKHKSGHLLRILGFGFGIAVGVGNTIGSGIFRTPGEVAGYLGSASLLFVVWILGGFYALLCSSSITELGTMLPTAGGWYVYSRRAFGDNIGFVVGCCDWTMQCVGNAYMAVALGDFAGGLFPALAGHVQFVAVAALALLALLNWIGLRTGSYAQEITSLAKGVGLIALVIACFTISPKTGTSAPAVVAHLFTQKHSLFLGLLLAMQAVIITYDGWYVPIYFVEEDLDPSRNLPRAMIGTALSCMVIFVLVNAALFHVLHIDGLAGSLTPASDAAMRILGPHGNQAILLLSVVTVLSSTNSGLLVGPRILFAMARDGLMPTQVTSVNTGGTPTRALFLCSFASIAMVLTGTFDTLIAIGSILFVAVYMSGFFSLLVLRRREPELARPYKSWWYPWSTVAVLVASAGFLVGSIVGDPKHSLIAVILIGASYIASIFLVRNKAYAKAID